jgi:hypothetical protein
MVLLAPWSDFSIMVGPNGAFDAQLTTHFDWTSKKVHPTRGNFSLSSFIRMISPSLHFRDFLSVNGIS